MLGAELQVCCGVMCKETIRLCKETILSVQRVPSAVCKHKNNVYKESIRSMQRNHLLKLVAKETIVLGRNQCSRVKKPSFCRQRNHTSMQRNHPSMQRSHPSMQRNHPSMQRSIYQ
ncbi:hypothetical protein AVEN_171333-1 [Araneus ventricosus]|uniref:Uncharacterized protein n=1 Tax=Araneus ventricosus TaxID=182803 RepID=A0A4Y2M5B6_ARAVE|nr:hypothetical protein AVEN_171333-1 [Araneus ventricosus]